MKLNLPMKIDENSMTFRSRSWAFIEDYIKPVGFLSNLAQIRRAILTRYFSDQSHFLEAIVRWRLSVNGREIERNSSFQATKNQAKTFIVILNFKGLLFKNNIYETK